MGRSDPGVWRALTLVTLRTLVGWHFLYEGFVKLWSPAWSRAGAPLPQWSAEAYLRSSSGPFADPFRRLADSAWLGTLGIAVAVALLVVGASLTLGLFTQAGCGGAIALLAIFYLSHLPTHGVQLPGTEGAYLIVDKNLIEAAAVAVVCAFRTGEIAGLDLFLRRARATAPDAARP
jgi:thiosulfate dehydrogenase [quinone] large subunit